MIKFIVPYPPSVNHYWGLHGKRIYVKAKGLDYRRRVKGCFVSSMVPLQGDLGLFLDIWHPDRRKRDLDNVLKPLIDALQAAKLLEDDSQISEIHAVRRGVKKPGMIEVEVW